MLFILKADVEGKELLIPTVLSFFISFRKSILDEI